MGADVSALREKLDASTSRCEALERETAELKSRLSAAETAYDEKEKALARLAKASVVRLDAQRAENMKETKRAQLCEELRREDSVLMTKLGKLLLHATPDTNQAAASAGVAQALGAGAREALGAGAPAAGPLDAARLAEERRKLCRLLWLRGGTDATFALRSSRVMAQTGLKLPHEEEGLVGSLGVLRRFGAAEGASGPWAALGGSLLWDARQRKLAALQVAACAEPSPSQLVCLGVDQTGALTGSVRSTVDSFTLLASASVDLSRRKGPRFGVDLSFDVE